MTMDRLSAERNSWKLIGLVILCVRFVQGFIYWGGGSRRFIYAPEKLDPHAAQWMANKLQSAMPGALLGISHVISWLLQHFILLYVAIILFSLAELFSGLFLIFGFFTRLSAFISVLLSISLMLIFGWEGGTCVDEWTMAVSNLAMGLTLLLSGASIYSIDSWLCRRYSALNTQHWFVCLASGELTSKTLQRASLICFGFAVFFTLATYNYYRGAIFSAYHAGPVSAVQHHITLTHGSIALDGTVTFTAYVDAGTPSLPSYFVRAELVDSNNAVVETWSGSELIAIAASNIKNKYDYNRITIGHYGLVAPVSAEARIVLSPVSSLQLKPDSYQLRIYTIEGKRWDLRLSETLSS